MAASASANPSTSQAPRPQVSTTSPPFSFWRKYQNLPAYTSAAQRDLLILQAKCKVAGQDMDQEFERIRQVMDHYFALLRDLQQVGTPAKGN